MKLEGSFRIKEIKSEINSQETLEEFLMTRHHLDYRSALKVKRILKYTGISDEDIENIKNGIFDRIINSVIDRVIINETSSRKKAGSIDGKYIQEQEHDEKTMPPLTTNEDDGPTLSSYTETSREEPTMSDYAEVSMKAQKILAETKLSIAALERKFADSFERLRR